MMGFAKQKSDWIEVQHMFKAKSIMKTNVISVDKDTEIYEAIKILVESNITGLPVVHEDQTLAGIITEKDVLKLLYDFEDVPDTVGGFMTEQVTCFDQEDSLIDIADSFTRNHFRRVPILDKGRLVGIISRKDIIGYILKLRHKVNV
jgi:CBS domain-containing protein